MGCSGWRANKLLEESKLVSQRTPTNKIPTRLFHEHLLTDYREEKQEGYEFDRYVHLF